jgi:hypothetical protein
MIDGGLLFSEFEKRGYILVFWHKDDIVQEAKRMGVTLTEEQIDIVADELVNNFDANNGLSWDTIRYEIEKLLDQQ